MEGFKKQTHTKGKPTKGKPTKGKPTKGKPTKGPKPVYKTKAIGKSITTKPKH